MKIVTFNIRYDNPDDGHNAFARRKQLITEAITAYQPDIIGFQEVLPHFAQWLKETFTDYYCVGHGREADLEGEHVMLAYRKLRYNLHSVSTFWLSPTPRIAGSRYAEQSICPRTCISAVFEDGTHNRFRVYNTHLDHEGAPAREQAVEQILETIKADCKTDDLPFILMGDFNAEPSAAELRINEKAAQKGLNLIDISADSGGTFHNFGRLPPVKIDYIFAGGGFKASVCKLWKDSCNGVFLSDHYPVEAEISIPCTQLKRKPQSPQRTQRVL